MKLLTAPPVLTIASKHFACATCICSGLLLCHIMRTSLSVYIYFPSDITLSPPLLPLSIFAVLLQNQAASPAYSSMCRSPCIVRPCMCTDMRCKCLFPPVMSLQLLPVEKLCPRISSSQFLKYPPGLLPPFQSLRL